MCNLLCIHNNRIKNKQTFQTNFYSSSFRNQKINLCNFQDEKNWYFTIQTFKREYLNINIHGEINIWFNKYTNSTIKIVYSRGIFKPELKIQDKRQEYTSEGPITRIKFGRVGCYSYGQREFSAKKRLIDQQHCHEAKQEPKKELLTRIKISGRGNPFPAANPLFFAQKNLILLFLSSSFQKRKDIKLYQFKTMGHESHLYMTNVAHKFYKKYCFFTIFETFFISKMNDSYQFPFINYQKYINPCMESDLNP